MPEKKKKVKYDELGREIEYKNVNPMVGVIMPIVYIVVVLIASALLSYYIITIGNDVFAFKKKDIIAEISLGNYVTVSELADTLAQEGVIKYPSVFKLYARLKEEDSGFLPGRYEVSAGMNYDTLLSFFKKQTTVREIVTVTIPEGYTVDEIIDLFISRGMGTEDGFVQAIQTGDFSRYEFVRRLDETQLSEARRYRLEGYLFPDTYEFYKDWDEERILQTLLDGFEAKFYDEYYEAIDKSGMTVDEYIILASMIQREAKLNTDMEFVSSVFHNRLNNPQVYPRMESDATIQYAYGVHKPTLTHEDTLYDHPYNTYVYDGLPPGAICNPGADAIYTAIQPAESDYYFFVSRANGEILFAQTRAEHDANVAAVVAES